MRMTSSLQPHSFYKGTFRLLTVSLEWIYAISEGCALCAQEHAFPS